MTEELKSERIIQKKLHSKFYIFLSPNFNEHNPNGMVIMGSSNLSAQGLGLEDVEHNYEMNIELRDYENVKFADDEFEKLWEQSTAILPVDAPSLLKKTYLDANPTPFELYVKFLIEFFGKNIDYDPDSISDIPLTMGPSICGHEQIRPQPAGGTEKARSEIPDRPAVGRCCSGAP